MNPHQKWNKLYIVLFALLLLCTACPRPTGHFEGCGINGQVYTSGYKIIDFPGNEYFRRHIEGHLVHLAEMAIAGTVEIEFYDDRRGPNALAFSRSLYNPAANYTILIGENLLWESALEIGNDNLETVLIWAILAHEFAHLTQYQVGLKGPTHQLELMADVISGWYVGLVLSRSGRFDIDRDRAMFAMNGLYRMGDYNFNNPDHHGTPEQRARAFWAGLLAYADNDARNYDDAFDLAFQYIATNVSP